MNPFAGIVSVRHKVKFMNYTIEKIATIISASVLGDGNKDIVIKNILIDSRKLVSADTSLFFSIKGERHDGHTYIFDLYEKGVRLFVVTVPPTNIDDYSNTLFLVVQDTMIALQNLAAFYPVFHFPTLPF